MQIGSSTSFHLLIGSSRSIIHRVDAVRLWLDCFRPNGAMAVPELGHAVTFPAGDRRLHGWFVAADPAPRGVVLLFHGIGDRLHFWRLAQQLLQQHGFSSLVFDYAGYGSTEGATTPENLQADGLAAYAWLQSITGGRLPVFPLGFSLGTGLLAEIAGQLEPAPSGVILCQSYTSLRKAARRVVQPLHPLAALLPDIWKTEQTVLGWPFPLLLVHGTEDELFPPEMSDTLAAGRTDASLPTELALIPGYAHNAIYRHVPQAYWAPILKFLDTHTRPA